MGVQIKSQVSAQLDICQPQMKVTCLVRISLENNGKKLFLKLHRTSISRIRVLQVCYLNLISLHLCSLHIDDASSSHRAPDFSHLCVKGSIPQHFEVLYPLMSLQLCTENFKNAFIFSNALCSRGSHLAYYPLGYDFFGICALPAGDKEIQPKI